MDAEVIAYAVVGLGALGVLGRWIVPLLGRMLESATTGARASGDIVQILQEERNHWKAHAERLDNTLQELRKDWIDMKIKFDLMEYQLNQALDGLRAYQERKDAG